MSCDFVKENRDGALIIRKAEMDDYDAVAMLEELEFCAHLQARPDYFKSLEISYPKTELEELLSLSCPISWLAVQNGKVIGLHEGTVFPDGRRFKSEITGSRVKRGAKRNRTIR